ncbi:hypothetical protein [Bacillus wiedmannii]|uniref:hypothetical protein n=1 Tax=Bacillus wiedmannii TaxID=1890302 RepID=UPI0015C51F37|nr:hypothetical protein [Bacillus wiedmannii]
MNFYFLIPPFAGSKTSASKIGEYKGSRREFGAQLMVHFLPAKGMDRSRVHYKNNV